MVRDEVDTHNGNGSSNGWGSASISIGRLGGGFDFASYFKKSMFGVTIRQFAELGYNPIDRTVVRYTQYVGRIVF